MLVSILTPQMISEGLLLTEGRIVGMSCLRPYSMRGDRGAQGLVHSKC